MNDLPTCSACGRRHLPVATRCPHCGHAFFRDPYEETTYEPKARLKPALLVAGGLLTAAGVGFWAVSQEGPLGPSLRPARVTAPPVQRDTAPTPAPTTDTAAPPAQEPAPVTALAVVAAPPAAEQPAPPPPTGVTMRSRWASTWANVREGPDLGTPVVMVLDPGERVDVGERDRGYWRVYVDGQAVGYVAGSLLLLEPPPS